ncbi:MAG: type II toxin-antitoxin system VapC family toxin [Thermomicrobiales bacterium]
MVIDTSAILAILLQEPEAERFIRAITAAQTRLLSAASLLEAGMLAQYRSGDSGNRDLDRLLITLRIEIATVTEQQAAIAREAHRRFGKGLHPASLNYGDCFAYALARESGEPLLFKGDDFSRTDVAIAAY